MPDAGMNIDRLNGIASAKANGIEVLAEFQKFAIIRPIASTPSAIHIITAGRATDSAEHHVIAANALIVFRVAGMGGKFTWSI